VLNRRLVEDIANRLRPGGEGLIEKDWHVVRAMASSPRSIMAKRGLFSRAAPRSPSAGA